jgi:site-specific recombinase XerC
MAIGTMHLRVLRDYWKAYRPNESLFPGLIPGQPLSARNVQQVFKTAKEKAGINKNDLHLPSSFYQSPGFCPKPSG